MKRIGKAVIDEVPTLIKLRALGITYAARRLGMAQSSIRRQIQVLAVIPTQVCEQRGVM